MFYCRSGDTEKLALSAAVGAVQARALIRLRRLPEIDTATAGETLTRMRKEYVAPTEADILGADAFILAAPPGFTSSSPELAGFLELIARLKTEGKLQEKVAAGIANMSSVIFASGCITASDTSDDPIALGRKVADTVRALKKQKETP